MILQVPTTKGTNLPTIQEWVDGKTAGHTFGKNGYSSSNCNITGRFPVQTQLQARHVTLTFEPGTEYCIYRHFRYHGHEIIASIFDGDTIFNVYAGGTIRRKRAELIGAEV